MDDLVVTEHQNEMLLKGLVQEKDAYGRLRCRRFCVSSPPPLMASNVGRGIDLPGVTSAKRSSDE